MTLSVVSSMYHQMAGRYRCIFLERLSKITNIFRPDGVPVENLYNTSPECCCHTSLKMKCKIVATKLFAEDRKLLGH
jgi:hypothetical protein